MKILIATGIYPPDIGGPAQYAYNLEHVWKKDGHSVTVKTFGFERRLPPGARHLYYFFKSLLSAYRADLIFILDTFSVAVPSVLLGIIFGKKTIIRTGGDFLWESYVERTGERVLLRNFYKTCLSKLSLKEKIIFSLTKWVVKHVSILVFSTAWQKEIWFESYKLNSVRTEIIENYYGDKESSSLPPGRHFIASTRPLVWKNHERVKEAFQIASTTHTDLSYDNSTVPFKSFMERLSRSYAVIQASLGDISPNMVLDAIRHDKPFIITRETGIADRIKDCAIFVDPEDVNDIAQKIIWLCDPINYEQQANKVKVFTFRHTWRDISDEILKLIKEIK